MKSKNQSYFVYIVQCRNGSFYTGTAKNIKKRIQQHNEGKGAKFTRAFGPVTLLASKRFGSRSKACRVEAQIKKGTHQDKLNWIKNVGGSL